MSNLGSSRLDRPALARHISRVSAPGISIASGSSRLGRPSLDCIFERVKEEEGSKWRTVPQGEESFNVRRLPELENVPFGGAGSTTFS